MTSVPIRGATIVSVDPKVGDLDRGDILVHGDAIAAVGPDLADRTEPDATVIDGQNMIAIPGFIDSHVHAWEGQLRGCAPGADFGEYLGVIAFGHGPHYRPQDVYAGTLTTAYAALDAGITTLIDNSHNAHTPDHAAAAVEALRDCGIRGVHAVGSPFGMALEHVPSTAVELRERYASSLISVRLFEVDPTPHLWRFARDAQLWISTELGRGVRARIRGAPSRGGGAARVGHRSEQRQRGQLCRRHVRRDAGARAAPSG